MTFTMLDFIFFAIIALCIIVCSIKGFVDSLFDKAAPVLSLVASFLFFKTAMNTLFSFIPNPLMRTLASFLVIFVVVFIVVKIVQSLIGNIFDNKILGPLNHTLGFMFGIVEGLVIVGLILFLLTTQNLFNAGGILSGSFFNGIFQSVYGGLNV